MYLHILLLGSKHQSFIPYDVSIGTRESGEILFFELTLRMTVLSDSNCLFFILFSRFIIFPICPGKCVTDVTTRFGFPVVLLSSDDFSSTDDMVSFEDVRFNEDVLIIFRKRKISGVIGLSKLRDIFYH